MYNIIHQKIIKNITLKITLIYFDKVSKTNESVFHGFWKCGNLALEKLYKKSWKYGYSCLYEPWQQVPDKFDGSSTKGLEFLNRGVVPLTTPFPIVH